jgi:hypothetical protein
MRPSSTSASRVASIAAQTSGPPPKVVPRSPAASFGQRLGPNDDRGRRAGRRRAPCRPSGCPGSRRAARRERRAAAAEAALDLVEDQQGTGLLGDLARGDEVVPAERVGAREPLHRLEDQRGGARRRPPRRAARSRRAARTRRRTACPGKPYQRSEPQETAAAAAVRPWKAPSIATALRRPRSCERRGAARSRSPRRRC